MNYFMQTWLDSTRMSLRFAQAWLDLLHREWGRLWTSPTTSVLDDSKPLLYAVESTRKTGDQSKKN